MKMRKQLLLILALTLTPIFTSMLSTSAVRLQPSGVASWDESDYSSLADRINAGLVSEEQFLRMDFDKAQTLEVFKHIRDKRGWTLSNEELKEALDYYMVKTKSPASTNSAPAGATVAAVGGSCDQWVELEKGENYAAYPVGQIRPNSGECGPDNDDIILLYNTPNVGRGNPDNVRVWSYLWTVRAVIKRAYRGGVGANGLCHHTTRVCMGSAGQKLGRDLNTLYLWLK
jgi:hypothetical protein